MRGTRYSNHAFLAAWCLLSQGAGGGGGETGQAPGEWVLPSLSPTYTASNKKTDIKFKITDLKITNVA